MNWKSIFEKIIVTAVVSIAATAFFSYLELKELGWTLSSLNQSFILSQKRIEDHELRLRQIDQHEVTLHDHELRLRELEKAM